MNRAQSPSWCYQKLIQPLPETAPSRGRLPSASHRSACASLLQAFAPSPLLHHTRNSAPEASRDDVLLAPNLSLPGALISAMATPVATAPAVVQLRSWSSAAEVQRGVLPLWPTQSLNPRMTKVRHSGMVVRAAVKVDSPSSLPIKKRPQLKRNQYDITTFTTWLIQQE